MLHPNVEKQFSKFFFKKKNRSELRTNIWVNNPVAAEERLNWSMKK